MILSFHVDILFNFFRPIVTFITLILSIKHKVSNSSFHIRIFFYSPSGEVALNVWASVNLFLTNFCFIQRIHTRLPVQVQSAKCAAATLVEIKQLRGKQGPRCLKNATQLNQPLTTVTWILKEYVLFWHVPPHRWSWYRVHPSVHLDFSHGSQINKKCDGVVPRATSPRRAVLH